MCWKGMLWRPISKAALMPAVKADIQAVTQGGTTTRPKAPMPRPAMIEAAMTWVPGVKPGEHVQRQADPQRSRAR